MDKEVKFSFLKLFNSIKGVHKPEPTYDENYLNQQADSQTNGVKKMESPIPKSNTFQNIMQDSCKSKHIIYTTKYPVLFGKGKNQYMGMLATDDILPNETMIQVPGKLVMSTSVCFNSEIQHIFKENPEVFGKHTSDGEDNILIAYILYELGKGEKSFWKPMFDVWPKPGETDLLMNWSEEDLEFLQDATLIMRNKKKNIIQNENQQFNQAQGLPQIEMQKNITALSSFHSSSQTSPSA